MTPFLVIALRLIIPFSILRWPFWGMIASIAADGADVVILDATGTGFFGHYHQIDKVLDTYYLAFAAYISLKWQDELARRTSMMLFLWRLVGVIVFEVTRIRQVIFFAPNIFENFYLLVAGFKQFFPKFKLDTAKKLTIFLFAATIPKLIQEYIMHFLEFQTWAFIKHNIFRWK